MTNQYASIYLDNAATTYPWPEVVAEMANALSNLYGNPSSTHQFGRKTKAQIELARKKISKLIGCEARNIIFTSSATEANNLALKNIYKQGVKRFISSPLEHKSVIETLKDIQKTDTKVEIIWMKPDETGALPLHDLDILLDNPLQTCVSLMHANNEIGNFNDLTYIAEKVRRYKALLHTDMVQTIGHYPIDLLDGNIDFATASAHKFHGPKGVGFLYAKNPEKISPEIIGGGQERGYRSGTENIAGIMGMAKALELAIADMDKHREYIEEIKKYTIERLLHEIKDICFNGQCLDFNNSLYTVLNFQIPESDLLAFKLDMENIAISQGSACNSGAVKASHVISEIYGNTLTGTSIRLSFSSLNTKEEIDRFVEVLKKIHK